jgi:hypothetical protein
VDFGPFEVIRFDVVRKFLVCGERCEQIRFRPRLGQTGDAFAAGLAIGSKVTMLADGNGDFTRAVGLELDGSKFGMGLRSQRYALVVDHGVVKHVAVEQPGKFEVSKAEAVLAAL